MTAKVTFLISLSTIPLAGLLFMATSTPAITFADCSNLKGCERKLCELGKQLTLAQNSGNKQRADGLKKSLEQAKTHCTDKGLREDLVKNIKAEKEDITEYEVDLKTAEEALKADTICKFQKKITEKKSKITRLETELSDLD